MYEHFKNTFKADKWAFLELIPNLRAYEAQGDNQPRILAHHIIMAYDLWHRRMFNGDLTGFVFGTDLETDKLEAYAIEVYDKWIEAMSPSKIADLAMKVSYKNLQGNPHISRLDEVLTHITHHSAYHRGQIQSKLKLGGIAPVKNDLILYFRTQTQS